MAILNRTTSAQLDQYNLIYTTYAANRKIQVAQTIRIAEKTKAALYEIETAFGFAFTADKKAG